MAGITSWVNRCWLLLAVLGLIVLSPAAVRLSATSLAAVDPPLRRPFSAGGFDTQEFLEQIFGPAPPQDRQRLAKIPISIAEERQWGRAAAEAYLDQLRQRNVTVVSRGKDIEYLKRLVELVRLQMDSRDRYPVIKVYLAQSSDTDARCFPGGTVVFHRGLLEFARSEAALVGILGHELSHLDHGHQLINARRMKLAQQTFNDAPAVTAERFFEVGTTWLQMFTRPFQPEDETQADFDGATWAYRAGYDSREMAALFLRLHQRDRGNPLTPPAFLRTHPFHIDRYRALMARHEELVRLEPRGELYVGQQNLRQRLTWAQHQFDQ